MVTRACRRVADAPCHPAWWSKQAVSTESGRTGIFSRNPSNRNPLLYGCQAPRCHSGRLVT